METIKTAVVVTCLLGVLYGVYTILNKPDAAPPPEVAAAFENGSDVPNLDIDFGASDFADGGEFPADDAGFADTGFAGDAGFSGPEPEMSFPSPEEAMNAETYADVNAAPPLAAIEPYDSGGTESAIEAYQPSNTLPGNSPPPTSLAANAGVGAEGGYVPTADPADALNLNAPGSLTPPDSDASLAPPPIEPALPGLDPAQTPYDSTTSAPPIPPLDTAPPSSAPIGQQYADPTADPNADPAALAPPLATEPSSEDPPVANANVGPDVQAQAGADTQAPAAEEAPLRPFERARRSALAQIDAKQLRQALFTLSLFYNDPELTAAEHQQLLDLLDPLAGTVIYSRQHLLTSAHVTTQGEDLEAVAAKYQVPAKLLANINGVTRPDAMTSGMELKVVPGPFRAEVDLTKGELTLFVQRLYAGRFPISVGNDPTPREGEYTIKEKQPGQTYYTASGGTIAANDPTNPYGGHWIDLGGISVHGSSQQPSSVSQGCISLSPRDAADVYHILTVGSKVTVKR